MKTLIDILRKGNLELFHTSIISWLLDPKAEHGLELTLLRGLSETLDKLGDSSLKNAVMSGNPKVSSEVASYKSRYDIQIKIENSLFVLENKTKSIGGLSQFKQYKNGNNHLIALGFCDASFSPEVKKKYSVIKYGDILKILERIKLDKNNDFSVLVKHYRDFLKRELQLLKWISEYYSTNALPKTDNVFNTVESLEDYYTENDKRFLNLYYLEKLKEKICSMAVHKESKWVTDKNMQSGVWLANYKALPKKYIFNNGIKKLHKKMSAKMWFHIEMWDGVLSKSAKDRAGTLQLRCSTIQSNKTFHSKLLQILSLKGDEYNYPVYVKDNADSFYSVRCDLRKEDLLFPNMTKKLKDFMELFGTFVIT